MDRNYSRSYDRDYSSDYRRSSGRDSGRGHDRRDDDRGFMERAGDEVRSWFGDDEAERRRRMDERYDERGDYGRNRGGFDRDYDRGRTSYDRSYGRGDYDRGYGRSSYGDRDRDFADRAGDEVRSWFGDDEAERRRRMDERYDERGDYGRNRGGFDRDYDRGRTSYDRGYGRGSYGDRDSGRRDSFGRGSAGYDRGYERPRGGTSGFDRDQGDRDYSRRYRRYQRDDY